MITKHYFRLVLPVLVALVALAALALILSGRSAYAQGGISVDKRLGRSDPTVFVGEYITFTIVITNNTTFTVAVLPLSDDYNEAVLRYVDAQPISPDIVDEPGGNLGWTDLTTHFGDLAPGENVLIVVGFIAEHPEPTVVNAAWVHDAFGDEGQEVDRVGSSITNTAVGGSSPVEKSLAADSILQVGMPITYTIVMTNNGFVTMTMATLVDEYNPAWLTFSHAVPMPDQVDPVNGVLTWTDIVSWTGPIPPHEAISVTTVFTALVSGDDITNSVQASGARDWYGNDLDGGADWVPIRIIERPTSTPQPTATPQPTSTSAPGPAPQPTNTLAPTLVAAAPTAVEATPAVLPKTGQSGWPPGFSLFLALLVLGAGLVLIGYAARRAARDAGH